MSLLILLLYLVSAGVIACLLRLICDPYGHFSNAKNWRDCFGVAVIWPWYLAKLAFLLAWAWWSERDYD